MLEIHILAVGDVVGEPGLRAPGAPTCGPCGGREDIAFAVVNGENAAGVGLTPDQALPDLRRRRRRGDPGQPHL